MTPANGQHGDGPDARRQRARRTAWLVGLIAAGVYVAFILSGVLSK